jgi:hypothetical protein
MKLREDIEKIIYEGYRLAWSKGEYPDGLEVTSKSVTEAILKAVKEMIEGEMYLADKPKNYVIGYNDALTDILVELK